MNYASYSKLFKELKNGIEIIVSQAVFELQIKTVKMLLLDQKIKNRLAYLNLDAIFEFLGQFTLRCIYHFSKDVDDFEIEHKHANFGAFWGRRCSTSLTAHNWQKWKSAFLTSWSDCHNISRVEAVGLKQAQLGI